MDDKLTELLEALKPIVEQDPEVMFRGHAEDYVKIGAIPISQYHRFRLAYDAISDV